MEEHGPVLDIRTYLLLPGTRDEFDRIFREHARPLLERHGIDVVAAGPSLLGDDLYTLVRSFDSLEQRREQLEGFYGSDEWLENYDAAVTALIETYHVVVVPRPRG
ncbi:MAG: NIPSNAP family protein [Gaiellaceae bacterium]